ncbi:MAG: hypothetical protein AB3N21_15855 [Ruegeria sp.]|uniref:hypothetical protein n=1 Tax=Ruegeria sp. TaxID=1879320 RepID=UPI00349E5E71
MYDREFSGSLVVACSGPAVAETAMTGFGEMRSRSGANLKYTSADACKIHRLWSKDGRVSKDAHALLIDPSAQEFAEAIDRVSDEIGAFPQQKTGIDLYFAGHGRPGNGALVFKDNHVTATQFIKLVKKSLVSGAGVRGLSITLDSCYSGAFLFETIVALQKDCDLQLYDALCSSMHDEKSWELSFLGHGAFTYAHLNKGNKYVDPIKFAQAIDEQDDSMIAKYLQGVVASNADPTAFLTRGRQHSIDCVRGGDIDAGTRGRIDVSDLDWPLDVPKIVDGLQRSIR